ncbi:MAG: type II toxin-antitoxin system HicA family toxin [Acidobacteria bacterium]|nr:type II toxin-antitoxin system HicA family toxin [Acidobacteriota bacterium]
MPRLPRLTASDAEVRLFQAGFVLLRTKGSHRIYGKGESRIVVPFHSGRMLHPKIVKSVLEATEYADE